MRELSALKSLKHRNIVRYYGKTFTPEGNLCIIMELCDGTLDNLIKSPRWMLLAEVSFIARQIIIGLGYMHHENIIHRCSKAFSGRIFCQLIKKKFLIY